MFKKQITKLVLLTGHNHLIRNVGLIKWFYSLTAFHVRRLTSKTSRLDCTPDSRTCYLRTRYLRTRYLRTRYLRTHYLRGVMSSSTTGYQMKPRGSC
jgi:hypothetical protein